jgi:DNA-binding FadR family transcriptional regulator
VTKDRRGRAARTEAATEQPASNDTRLRAFRIAGASVHAALAGEIGLRIVRGDYPPGATLPNEQRWSQTFNVSRSAVREAIKMLTAKNLLASRRKVGSRVEPRERWNLLDRDVLGWYASAPDRLKFLRTVQEFRYIIEPEATALAATRRSDAQMTDISRACSDMRAARFLSERTEADARFHVAILRASGNELLVPLGVLIESALENLFGFITSEVSDLKYAQELHEDIEKCVRLRRREAARRAVRRLLSTTDEIIARAAPRSFGPAE